MRIPYPTTHAPYQILGARERLKDLTGGLNRFNGPTIASQDPGLTYSTSLELSDASSAEQ